MVEEMLAARGTTRFLIGARCFWSQHNALLSMRALAKVAARAVRMGRANLPQVLNSEHRVSQCWLTRENKLTQMRHHLGGEDVHVPPRQRVG